MRFEVSSSDGMNAFLPQTRHHSKNSSHRKVLLSCQDMLSFTVSFYWDGYTLTNETFKTPHGNPNRPQGTAKQ